MKTLLKKIDSSFSKTYTSAGYPLLPITKLIRQPMRWYYHQSPLLRHDSKVYLKPFLLERLHSLFVLEHPQDFHIYQNQIKFRSYGSLMSVQAYYVGEVEHHLKKYLVNQICPNFVMLDIGAHHGAYTLVAAYELKKRGWQGKIHSFEPDPNNFALLEYNVKQNQLEDYVSLHNCAVGDKTETQNLVMYEDNSGNFLESATALNGSTDMQSHLLKVNVIKLDEYFSDLEKLDLIKMDIQGAEPLALAGAINLFKKHQPTLIIEAMQQLPYTQKVRNILQQDFQYQIHGVNKSGHICPVGSPEAYVSWDWIGLVNPTILHKSK
jgi:FkbM family methyltransferase